MDVLHRDEVLARRFADVVNLDDVLVVKVCSDASLVEEHANEPLIPRELRADPLEHDVSLEALDPIGAPQQDVRHTPRR
jgi:hypothetical protein